MYFNHVFTFSFSYVYIPILPAHLVEVLNSPTPYMAGVHSSLTEDTADLVSDNNLQILNFIFPVAKYILENIHTYIYYLILDSNITF